MAQAASRSRSGLLLAAPAIASASELPRAWTLCLRLGAGSQHADAEAKELPTHEAGDYLWMVLAPMVRYNRGLSELVKVFASVGASSQLKRQSFTVQVSNGGTERTIEVVSAPSVGLMAELGLSVGGNAF